MFKKNFVIGNTPMIKINFKYKNKEKCIYSKLEYYNLTGSIKDRVAFYILNNAKKKEILKEHMPIVEATSGNTGISLAALGAYYKHPVYIYMPDWSSIERIKIMKSYGASVHLISKKEGGFVKCVEEARNKAIELNGFLANQFANEDNFLAHYETTAEEIINQLPEKISSFVSGVGTGGTLMGIGKRLKERYNDFKVIGIEPEKMPMITAKISGGLDESKFSGHKIEGIGDDFIPDLVDIKVIDEIFLINDEDAINMSRKLANQLGLGVGISSGANFLGSILAGEKAAKPVVTVFADDNKKYLSTDLSKDIDLKSDFLSNKIELVSYEIV